MEDILKRVLAARSHTTLSHGEQVEVVIAQYCHRSGPKPFDESQDRRRLWASVDQVANEPKPVSREIKVDLVQELLQSGVTALNVTDCENRHSASFCSAGRVRSRAWEGHGWSWLPRGVCLQGYLASILLRRPPRAVNSPVTMAHTGRQPATTSCRMRLTAFS